MSSNKKFYSPLNIGLLIVSIAYFLFTLHAILTVEWIGEWDRISSGIFSFRILIEDISATIGMIFRLAGSVLALALIIYYLLKKNLQQGRLYLAIRLIIVFEGIYWLGLITSGATGIYSVATSIGNRSATFSLYLLFFSVIPTVVESTAVPIALFMLAYRLNPRKSPKLIIKWALISATMFSLAFWLLNTGLWASTLRTKGLDYVLVFPQNMASFLITIIGLLALTIYAAYFAKSSLAENFESLNLKPIGTIILGLGLFYLSTYLIWVFFVSDNLWSSWYAWLLGHNLDLWMLSLPLVGVPLLFDQRRAENR